MVDLQTERFIADWGFPPAEVPVVRALQGYLGDSPRTSQEIADDGTGNIANTTVSWWRLYSSLDLDEFYEFPESSVVNALKIVVSRGATTSGQANIPNIARQAAVDARNAAANASSNPSAAVAAALVAAKRAAESKRISTSRRSTRRRDGSSRCGERLAAELWRYRTANFDRSRGC